MSVNGKTSAFLVDIFEYFIGLRRVTSKFTQNIPSIAEKAEIQSLSFKGSNS